VSVWLPTSPPTFFQVSDTPPERVTVFGVSELQVPSQSLRSGRRKLTGPEVPLTLLIVASITMDGSAVAIAPSRG